MSVIEEREKAGPIFGRDYKKTEEGDLWGYYRNIIYLRDDYRCQYCGVRNDEHENPSYHIDHIFPVSRGGKTELANLQLLCEPCNMSKSTKAEGEFSKKEQAKWYKNRNS
jgi:5-methylcytosine-specific restriction endonuclease McrA